MIAECKSRMEEDMRAVMDHFDKAVSRCRSHTADSLDNEELVTAMRSAHEDNPKRHF